MKKSITVLVICLMTSILTFRISLCQENKNCLNLLSPNDKQRLRDKTLLERLKSLEPDNPQNINDPPFFEYEYPSDVYSISEVIEKGTVMKIPLAYNNPKWERQAYKEYWHSNSGRWSYVPNRIHYAMHRLFTTYTTASVDYDFTHNLGIDEESKDFPLLKNPLAFIRTVVMKSNVLKIITYGNQVVIIIKPQRNGLQVYDIPTEQINPINPNEPILFQLVTELGDEIDYALIQYLNVKFN